MNLHSEMSEKTTATKHLLDDSVISVNEEPEPSAPVMESLKEVFVDNEKGRMGQEQEQEQEQEKEEENIDPVSHYLDRVFKDPTAHLVRMHGPKCIVKLADDPAIIGFVYINVKERGTCVIASTNSGEILLEEDNASVYEAICQINDSRPEKTMRNHASWQEEKIAEDFDIENSPGGENTPPSGRRVNTYGATVESHQVPCCGTGGVIVRREI